MFFKWDEAKAVQAVPLAIRRTVAVGDRSMIVEWTMQKGALVPLHDHEFEQNGYVVSGTVEMTVGEEKRVLKPGDGYSAASGKVHAALALEDAKIIDIFTPVRDDYR